MSNFKSAVRVARGRFEITGTITSEMYETKSLLSSLVEESSS